MAILVLTQTQKIEVLRDILHEATPQQLEKIARQCLLELAQDPRVNHEKILKFAQQKLTPRKVREIRAIPEWRNDEDMF